MSDFSQPEYASYIVLCWELGLEREFHFGDRALVRPAPPMPDLHYVAPHWTGFDRPIDRAHRSGIIWLPALSDWLEMLEGVGITNVGFEPQVEVDSRGWFCTGDGWDASGPTREEAAAKLWVAITTKEKSPAG